MTGDRQAQPAGRSGRASLRRLLDPRTVAIVAAHNTSAVAQRARGTLDSDAEVFLVNSRDETAWGRKTYPSLSAIGRPVDSVLCLSGAQRSVAVAEEAAATGAGGLVLIAAGFEETGRVDLRDRLVAAADRGGFPVVGPNGAGFVSVHRNLDMTFLARFGRRPGGVSAVVHSGAILESIAAAGYRSGGIGLNLMISAGNETVTDLCDYLDFLVDDARTKVILLAVESITRPEAFFSAVDRAHEAGKAIVALKIGRSERTAGMAASHTGRLTGASWVYDIAFRQYGIPLARDVNELVNRAQFLEQLPPRKWTEVKGLAVLTGSGGMAAVGGDLAEEESIPVPDVPRLNEWIGTRLPGQTVANPLDARGLTPTEVWQDIFSEYGAAEEFDTYLYLGQFADWDEGVAGRMDQLADSVIGQDKTLILSPFGGVAGAWLDRYRHKGVGVGNGVLETLQGIQTMGAVVRAAARRRRDAEVPPPPPQLRAELDRAVGLAMGRSVTGADGIRLLPFEESMGLLRRAGVPVAGFHLVHTPDDLAGVAFPPPYVAKLADVAHRTELGAVKTGLSSGDLPAAVTELQRIAESAGVPDLVVVQPAVRGEGEVFVGLRTRSELGPLVVFGLGGVFVEVLRRVAGRLAPFGPDAARELVAEFDDAGVLDGVRGRDPWNRDELAGILVAAGRLAATLPPEVESIDINPLIVTKGGFIAVDALVALQPPGGQPRAPEGDPRGGIDEGHRPPPAVTARHAGG